MTLDEWEMLFESQGCACAICGSKEPGSTKGWHTDHDHESGHIRGILCFGCNRGLGMLGDSLETVCRAVSYLREAQNRKLPLTNSGGD